MIHNDNVSKHDSCGLTLEELRQRIIEWNDKYGEYENTIDYTGLDGFKTDLIF